MQALEQFSERATRWAGSSWSLCIAFLLTVTWISAGPFLGFTDTWQLTYNTLSSVVTFLMVFVIQRDQNKQTLVLQTKLNELLAATKSSNRLIDIEDMTEDEVEKLHKRYQGLAKEEARSSDPRERTSVDRVAGKNTEAAGKSATYKEK